MCVFSVGIKIGGFYYYTEISNVNNTTDFVVVINNLFLYYLISFLDINIVFYNTSIENYLSRNLFFVFLYGMFYKKKVILCGIKPLPYLYYFTTLKNKPYPYMQEFGNNLIFFYFFRFDNIIIRKRICCNKEYYYNISLYKYCNIIHVKYSIIGIYSILFGVYYKLKILFTL
jgi:hypothetical protein